MLGVAVDRQDPVGPDDRRRGVLATPRVDAREDGVEIGRHDPMLPGRPA